MLFDLRPFPERRGVVVAPRARARARGPAGGMCVPLGGAGMCSPGWLVGDALGWWGRHPARGGWGWGASAYDYGTTDI